MVSSYFAQTLSIDVLIVNVEIVLNTDSIVETDGHLASCFLDADCTYVVLQVQQEKGDNGNSVDDGLAKTLTVCNIARVPREQLVLL